MMLSKRIKTILLCVIVLSLNLPGLWADGDYGNSVVAIRITIQQWDHHNPWQKYSPDTSSVSGIVIDGDRILTEAYPLTDHQLIQVMKNGDTRKYAGRVELKDYNANLAVITVPEEGFFENLNPVTFNKPGIPEGKTETALWEGGADFKIYETEYIKTYVKTYKYSALSICHRMSTEQSGSARGQPVFDEQGHCFGLVTNKLNGNGAVEVISVDTIHRFLKDLDDGTYEGVPSFWIENSPLRGDVHLKNYLGVAADQKGIYVSRVPASSSFSDTLLHNDVIIEIDNYVIDDSGNYDDPSYGKLYFPGIAASKHQVGDEITLKIIREGKETEVSSVCRPVNNDKFYIPPRENDIKPGYFLFGGMLFQELTRDYLTAFGRNWRQDADTRILYLYDTFEVYPEPGRRRIVILNKVFPHSVNIGYHRLKNEVLDTVDGIKVRDLAHAWELLKSTEEEFVRIAFSGGAEIILSPAAASAADKEILQNYGIPALSEMQ